MLFSTPREQVWREWNFTKAVWTGLVADFQPPRAIVPGVVARRHLKVSAPLVWGLIGWTQH